MHYVNLSANLQIEYPNHGFWLFWTRVYSQCINATMEWHSNTCTSEPSFSYDTQLINDALEMREKERNTPRTMKWYWMRAQVIYRKWQAICLKSNRKFVTPEEWINWGHAALTHSLSPRWNIIPGLDSVSAFPLV